jgi:hypothetical protein
LEGTGFEKLQIVQTHVAGVAEAVLVPALSDTRGGDGAPKDALDRLAGPRVGRFERFMGLGMSVTLAEDLRNPA